MKITYITNARIPTEKAHGYQICKMCEEFSKVGFNVELIVPTRKNNIKDSVFSYYNLENNFRIRYIRFFDFLKLERYLSNKAFYFNCFLFLIKAFFIKIDKKSLIYTRDPEVVFACGVRGFKVVYEAHSFPDNFLGKTRLKFLIKKGTEIVCNSDGTKNALFRAGYKKLIVANNGVDLEVFNSTNKSKEELRKNFNLPINRKIILYLGHLYDWKGVDTVVESSKLFAEDVLFLFVGGTDDDINAYKNKTLNFRNKNIIFYGRVSKKDVPSMLKSADVLVLPNKPISKESEFYTSPIKLFEYMASGIPIIASDITSIKNIVGDNGCLFFNPLSSRDLHDKILNILSNKDFSSFLVKNSLQIVKNYSWNNRAKKIINSYFYEFE